MSANDALLHNAFYGNYGVRLTAAIGFALLFGSIPVGAVIRWLFADFTPRVRAGAALGIGPLDALKGWIPVAVALHGAGIGVAAWCAAATLAGHFFSPWRRGRGGTGADCSAGVVFALAPAAAMAVAAVWCAVAIPLRSLRAGNIAASAAAFLPLWYLAGPQAAAVGIGAFAALALRLRADGEPFERAGVEQLDRAAAARRDQAALLQL